MPPTQEKIELILVNMGLVGKKIHSREIEALTNLMKEGELPQRAMFAIHNRLEGIFVATNLQIIFISAEQENFTKPITIKAYPYQQIKNVQIEKGEIQSRMRIAIGNEQCVFDSGANVLCQRITNYIDKRISINQVSFLENSTKEKTGEPTPKMIYGGSTGLNEVSERKAMTFKDVRCCLNRLKDFEEETILMDELLVMLEGGEFLVAGIEGIYNNTYKGILLATNQKIRILYFGPYNAALQESFSYDSNRITDLHLGLVGGDMIVFRSGDYFAVNEVASGRYKEVCDYIVESIYGLSKNKKIENTDRPKTEIGKDERVYQPRLAREEMKVILPPEMKSKEEVLNEYQPTGNPYIDKMRELNIAIEDQTISGYLDELEMICQDIFMYVEKNPGKEMEIKDFVNDYLPKTFHLLEKYDDLSTKALKTKNINHAMDEITQVLGVIVEAIKNLYDKIYENEARLISSDIKVLKDILTQHGLTKDSDQFNLEK
jgi:hypothetical protein